MNEIAGDAQANGKVGPFAPLRVHIFRNVWLASIFSNVGAMIFAVGAAWEMTRMSDSAAMVALVQTALMLPMFFVTVPSGAMADMFDKRKVAMSGLAISCASAAVLTGLAVLDLLTPWLLLGSCAVLGAGNALFMPAWQASIGELVDRRRLPAAIALASISFNLGRSAGPALGGIIVAAFGAIVSFGVNAVSYLPLLLIFLFWRREHLPSRLPPERLERAIVSGARYSFHSNTIRIALTRIFVLGIVGGAMSALAPLIAKDLLDGNAGTYGLLLSSIGVGAVVSALMMTELEERFGIERSSRAMLILAAIGAIVTGISDNLILTCAALFLAGGSYTLVISMMNITVQMSAPRWVVARALSLFGSAITGGVALGAWIWGVVAGATTVGTALVLSGAGFGLLYFLVRAMPLKELGEIRNDPAPVENEPEVALDLTMRSGPIVIVVGYEVDPGEARGFYDAMRHVETTRLRNGAFNWSLSRDIARPDFWAERFQFPTWGDYLRMRDRQTEADRVIHEAAGRFLREGTAPEITRRLERPFGSVRWKADSPDPKEDAPNYYPS